MKYVFRIIVVLLAMWGVTACGEQDTSTSKQAIQKQVAEKNKPGANTLAYQSAPAILNAKSVAVVGDGAVATIYNQNKQLVYEQGSNKTIISQHVSSNHHWLVSAGNYVYVFWWEKFANLVKGAEKEKITGKVVYVRSSVDGGKTFSDKMTITHAGGVLPKLRMVADQNGHITVVYLDERYGSFNIYTNSSQDGGKTWKKKDFQLDHGEPGEMKKRYHTAVSPNIAQTKNELVATWQQMDEVGDKRISRMYSRVSHDYGETWEKRKAIFDTDKTMSFSMQMYGDDQQVYLMAGMQEKGSLLFTKKPNKPWFKVDGVLPESDTGKGGNYYRFASDSKYLYVTYVFVEKVVGSKTFWHTEFVRFDLATQKWIPKSFRFDSRGMGVSSKGGYQDIVKLDDGTLVVVWEDFRRILPMIALNYSTDNGDSWLNIPLVISRQDIVNNSQRPFIRKLADKFMVFYQNNFYPEQTKPELKTIKVLLHSPQSKNFEKSALALRSLPSDDELKKRLIERFNLLKDARLNKKWKQAWPLQDPLYRNLYKKTMWLRTRDRLIFRKLDMESVKLDNPYGYVLGEMIYDLNPDFIDADPKDPKFRDQKKKFILKWGWFVDDWYLITETGTEPYLP